MNTNLKQMALKNSKILILALLLSVGLGYVSAWVGPTATPPAGNVEAPINVGISSQFKNGALSVIDLIANKVSSNILNVPEGGLNIAYSTSSVWGNYASTTKVNVAANKVLTSNGNGFAVWKDPVGGMTQPPICTRSSFLQYDGSNWLCTSLPLGTWYMTHQNRNGDKNYITNNASYAGPTTAMVTSNPPELPTGTYRLSYSAKYSSFLSYDSGSHFSFCFNTNDGGFRLVPNASATIGTLAGQAGTKVLQRNGQCDPYYTSLATLNADYQDVYYEFVKTQVGPVGLVFKDNASDNRGGPVVFKLERIAE